MREKLMKKALTCFLLLGALLLLGTGSKPKEQSAVQYDIIERGSDAANASKLPSLSIFTDQSDFKDFYSYLHMNKVPHPDAPEIDFAKNILVFLCYGEQKTAGYFISVRDVSERKETLVVKAVLLGPPEGSMSAQVITYPYLLMTVPRDYYRRVELVNEFGEVQVWKSL